MATTPKTTVNPAADAVKFVNSARNVLSQDYRNTIQIAKDFDDVKSIGKIVMSYPGFINEFCGLINKIAETYTFYKLFTNPFSVFKRGALSLGETIEMAFSDIIKPRNYDIEKAENEVYRKGDINVSAAYSTINSKIFYKTTIEPNQLAHAFISENGFQNLIESVTAQLYNSAEQDQFMAIKYLIALHCYNGNLYPINVGTVSKDNVKDVVTTIKAVSNSLEFPNTKYNPAGVHSYSKKSEQYLISTAEFDAINDVNVLSSAFNMDKAEFLGHRMLIDDFGNLDPDRLEIIFKDAPDFVKPSPTMLAEFSKIPAVLIDKDFLMIFEQQLAMDAGEISNPEGMYTNYWKHVWMAYQVNPFAPAIVFAAGAPDVTSVKVTPSALSVTKGQTAKLSATVVAKNFASKAVEWESSDPTNAPIDYNGTVYISDKASGSITITCKSKVKPSVTGTATITVVG